MTVGDGWNPDARNELDERATDGGVGGGDYGFGSCDVTWTWVASG